MQYIYIYNILHACMQYIIYVGPAPPPPPSEEMRGRKSAFSSIFFPAHQIEKESDDGDDDDDDDGEKRDCRFDSSIPKEKTTRSFPVISSLSARERERERERKTNQRRST